jgi:hypothetical protein
MPKSIYDYGNDFENNPRRFVGRFILWIFILSAVFGALSYAFGWFSEAADVAQEEFGPEASIEKYEWFEDCAATLEEKGHTIHVYEQNIADMDSMYAGTPRKDWDRLDKQQYNQWAMEITGLKASYNKVVAEYNAASAKFNWSLYNDTELPEHYDEYLDE